MKDIERIKNRIVGFFGKSNEEDKAEFSFKSPKAENQHSEFKINNPLKYIERSNAPLIFRFRCQAKEQIEDLTCSVIIKKANSDEILKFRWFIGAKERRVALDLSCIDDEQDEITLFFDKSLKGLVRLNGLTFISGDTVTTLDGKVSKIDFSKKWQQKGNRLEVTWYFGTYFMDVPDGFNLKDVNESVIEIVNYYLFGKVEEHILNTKTDHKHYFSLKEFENDNQRVGLSFSMGEDSTAARSILPDDTVSIYCRRDEDQDGYYTPTGSFYKLNRYVAAEKNMASVPNVYQINNNLEWIGLEVGLRFGFRNGFGYATISLMLADHFDIGVLCYGSVMEQVFLRDGTTYTDITSMPSSQLNTNKKLHRIGGVTMSLPTGCLSEVVTSKICQDGPFKGLAVSCPSANDQGEPCGICFKCFRKVRLLSPSLAKEPVGVVKEIISKRPLKSATSLLYACHNSSEAEKFFPDLASLDLDFLQRYYSYGLERLVPEFLLDGVRSKLAELGVEPMTSEEQDRLANITQFLNPEIHMSRKASSKMGFIEQFSETGKSDCSFNSPKIEHSHSLFNIDNPLKYLEKNDTPLLMRFLCQAKEQHKDWPCLILIKNAKTNETHKVKWFIGSEERRIALDLSCIENEDDEVIIYFDKNLKGLVTLKDVTFSSGDTATSPTGQVTKIDFSKKWQQKGNRLEVSWHFGTYFMEAPEGFSLSSVNQSVLDIVNYYLFGKVEEHILNIKTDHKYYFALKEFKNDNKKVGLSFSMGEDSTAARSILPDDTVSIYCRRDKDKDGYHTPSGSYIKLNKYVAAERNMLSVPNTYQSNNNLEWIGLEAGLRFGFRNNFGYATISLMLADHFNIGVLCYGSVMEQVFLRDGTTYTDITTMPSSLFNTNKKLHRISGVTMSLPAGCLSEVVTSRICRDGPFKGLAVSCPNANEAGVSCGYCFKCFRKVRLLSPSLAEAPTPAVRDTISKRPLKSASSVLYACHNSNDAEKFFPDLADVDVDFLQRYYGYGLEQLVPSQILNGIRIKLAELDIEPMTDEEEDKLSSLTQFLNPEVHIARQLKN